MYICIMYNVYIYPYMYLWIMEWTNTTLVLYSEFYGGGYQTIFNEIWFTGKKLQYNGFIQYNWCQSFVSYLESMYLFSCLYFDITSVFFKKCISW